MIQTMVGKVKGLTTTYDHELPLIITYIQAMIYTYQYIYIYKVYDNYIHGSNLRPLCYKDNEDISELHAKFVG